MLLEWYYYDTLQVSSNGLVSFNQQYLSWWPVPFPFGRSRIPVIAPFWADFDYRNNVQDSRIFYNAYDRSASSMLGRAIMEEFDERMGSEGGSDFVADWMAVVTWNEAILYPWYWQYNLGEVSITPRL